MRKYIIIITLSALFIPITHAKSKNLNAGLISSGTGFFINQDGYLVTNEHVVRNCNKITISGSVMPSPGSIVKIDKENDLAIIKASIAPKGYASLRSSSDISINDTAHIIDFLKKNKTKEYNIVNTKITDTKGPAGENWIQFSNTAKLGNSGGPLIDNYGNVVGVIRAKLEFYQVDLLSTSESQPENVKNNYIAPSKYSDIAISSDTLIKFLNKEIVKYHLARHGYNNYDVEGFINKYVVNIRCEINANDT